MGGTKILCDTVDSSYSLSGRSHITGYRRIFGSNMCIFGSNMYIFGSNMGLIYAYLGLICTYLGLIWV